MENDYYFSPDDPLYEVDTAEYYCKAATKSLYDIVLFPRLNKPDGQSPKSINEYFPDDKRLFWLSFIGRSLGKHIDDFGLPSKGTLFMSQFNDHCLHCTIESITPAYFQAIGRIEKTIYVNVLIES